MGTGELDSLIKSESFKIYSCRMLSQNMFLKNTNFVSSDYSLGVEIHYYDLYFQILFGSCTSLFIALNHAILRQFINPLFSELNFSG